MPPFERIPGKIDMGPLLQDYRIILTPDKNPLISHAFDIATNVTQLLDGVDVEFETKQLTSPSLRIESIESFDQNAKASYKLEMPFPELVPFRKTFEAGAQTGSIKIHGMMGLPAFYVFRAEAIAGPRQSSANVQRLRIDTIDMFVDQQKQLFFENVDHNDLIKMSKRNCHPKCDFNSLFEELPLYLLRSEDIGIINEERVYPERFGKQVQMEIRYTLNIQPTTPWEMSVTFIHDNRCLDGNINQIRYINK